MIRLPKPLEVLLLPPNKPLSKLARSPALADVVVLEEVLDVVLEASEAPVVPDGEVVEVAAAATELATPVAASDTLLAAAAGAVEAAAVLSAAAGTETETMGVEVAESALAAPVSEPAADVSAAGAVVEAAAGAVDATASLGASAAAVVVLATLVETMPAAAPWTMPEDEPFPAGEPTAKLASAAAVAIVVKTRIVIVEVIHTRTKTLYFQLPPPIVEFVE